MLEFLSSGDERVGVKFMKQKQFEFKIIAGHLKGRRITAPDLGVTRPPLSRIRKSIFDFLYPYLDGASYLDLFSGTGSYLFEAVSRGADKAVGVELEQQLVDQINKQAETLGVADSLECLHADVFDAIPGLSETEKFDIIMIAPPQYKGIINRTMSEIAACSILNRDGIILCQHDTSETQRIRFHGFELQQQRKYGNTTFSILGLPDEDERI